MKSAFDFEPGFEPERYELDARPAYRFTLRRRNFFKTVSTGIVVVLLVEPVVAQESGGRRRGSGNRPQDIGAWLHIAEDGMVTIYTGKVEVGQNIRTSLAQVVAEELRVRLASVRLVMSDTQLVPYDAGTFGSRTTPDMARQLSRVAAAARELLIDLAAEQWKTDRTSLTASDGTIARNDSKDTIEYGKLIKGQKLTKAVAENPPMTPPEQWKVAGKSVPKADGRALVTGQHKYASDVKLPGMLHGKVLRPPAFGATLVSVDTKEAAAMNEVVLVHDGNFFGVAAPTELQAARALKAIKAEWKTSEQVSGKQLFEHLKKTARGEGGRGASKAGSIEEGLAAADTKLKQTYTIAYIAHAPLEPRAAVAQWENEKLTVWTGTQRPFGVRSDLAGAFRISDQNVRVIVPDTGSGYGGKHRVETATEAARLAKAANKPVKVVWTRDEEFTWAYFRPAGVIEISSGARKDGTLTAFEFHNYNSGGAGMRPLYEVPNQVVEFHQSSSPLQQGSYRALASTANHFARETHIDELAHELRIDPLEFRLKNLKDPRLRAVLEAAAKAFGWGGKPDANRGFGIAVGSEKGGFIATCAEVSVDKDTGRVRIVRTLSVFECGAIINPDHLKSQVEGCMVMGIGGALTEAIEFEKGKILNPKFSRYRVPRFSDTPEIEVVLLDRKDLPSAGAGEAPIICIAPAIGNAIFNAAGVRLRSLPLAPNGVKV